MAIVKPFRAVRPAAEYAAQVAALPYDVMDSAEAREMVKGKPYSFLHVDKAEIDLDESIDIYDEKVYQKAKENLNKLIVDGILQKDAENRFYIYRLTMNGRSQAGIVGCCSIDDYENGIIKKHEFTRADKEEDRIRHVDTLDANTGPIFLAHRPQAGVSQLTRQWMEDHTPQADFTAEDGVGHTVWVIDDESVIKQIEADFAAMDALYIADGHHRCASAAKVGAKRRAENPAYTGEEEFNRFLAVIFPSDALEIMDYNRVVKDLNGNGETEFLEKLGKDFEVEVWAGNAPCKPQEKHSFGMYMAGRWYCLKAKEGAADEADPVGRLDVSLLQNKVLAPILGIGDPRTDKRIDFIGGIRGLEELERRVNEGMAVAFAMYPTTMDDLMAIADAGLVMPPKSTWFEPKLRSGLFIHQLK